MRPVLALAALGALVVGTLAACSDDDPFRSSERENASFALRPQLSQFGAAEMLPINLIRLTVVSLPDSAELIDPVERTVDPEDASWNQHLDVPLVGGQPVDVLVFVELINVTDGVRSIEWSGIAGPFTLEPGETTETPSVDMFRGSLDNLSITAVTIEFEGEPGFMEGESFVLHASAQGASGTPAFFWSSLDEAIAIVDTAAGDSAVIQSLLPGVARIVVEAGPRADTLAVFFQTVIEFVDISPTLDTIEVGAQTTLTATAYDAREEEVAATFSWSTDDVEIASVADGLVTGGTPGETWIRASANGIQDSARIVVRAPGGRTITWTGAVSTDWGDPANWSNGGVPGATDSVAIPASAARFPLLNTDAEVAAIVVDNGATLSMGEVILTVHGHAIAQGVITGSSATVMKDGLGAVEGTFPSLTLTAPTFLQGALVTDDNLYVNGIAFTPSSYAVTVGNTLWVYVGGSIVLGASDSVTVFGPTRFENAVTAGLLTGGSIVSHDDFTVVGDCGTFVSTGTDVVIADSAVVQVACPGVTGNRFDELRLTPGVDLLVNFQSDIVANRFTAIADDATVELIGPQTSITARVVEVNGVGIENIHLRQETDSDTDGLNLLNVTFRNFGTNDPQLVIVRPGDSPIFVSADFDATTAGPYVDVTDSDGAAPFVEVHLQSSNTDGPARTTVAGGAVVWWSGQPRTVVAVSGDAQTGNAGQPLPDSIRAQVNDVFGVPVAGAVLSWPVTEGGGSASPTSVLTDANGQGATSWTLGAAFTNQTLLASAPGVTTLATFTATSIAGAPGATITWTGTAGTDWSNTANWSPARLPTGADTAYVPAAALNAPILTASDSISGLIVEAGSMVDVFADTLVVTDYLEASGPIAGSTGLLRLRNTEVRHIDSEGIVYLPTFEVTGQTFLWNRVVSSGAVAVHHDSYLELTFGGLEVAGDVDVAGDNASFGVWDSLIVHGSLHIGGSETVAEAYLHNHSGMVVDGDLLVTGRGTFEFTDPTSTLVLGGNATWNSVAPGEGLMPEGTIEIAGDWHADGPAFHSPELLVVFNGTGGAQQITNLTPGHDAGQGHFGAVHVANPAGVVFLTPNLIHSDLTSDPGVPIAAGILVVEDDIDAGGDVTATDLGASSVTVAGALTASNLAMRRLLGAGAFAVDSTTYLPGDIETLTATINTSVAYSTLSIEADSAIFDGPATIAGNLRTIGHTRLGGRTAVGGDVLVNGPAGDLVLNGHTLEMSGANGLTVGAGGLITMTQPTDSLIGIATAFFGGSTVGRLTDGVIATSSFVGFGVAFHASGNHRVVLRSAATPQTLFMSGSSLADGSGARFATLRLEPTAPMTLQLGSQIAALTLETDSAALVTFSAPTGSHQTVVVGGLSLRDVTFVNTPLYMESFGGPLALDDVEFQGFDPGLIQLSVGYFAAAPPFVFTDMRFDSLDVGDTGSYVRATADVTLELEIQATNITNGADFTIEDPGAVVTWPNDDGGVPAPATIAWTGDVSSDWTDGANWNTAVAPVASDIVWIDAGRTNDPVVTFADTIAGLRLADGAALQLDDSLVVTGTVRAGTTITGGGTLHVAATTADTITGTVPALIAEDVTLGDASSPLIVTGNLTVRGGGAATRGTFEVAGDVLLEAGTLAINTNGVVHGSVLADGATTSSLAIADFGVNMIVEGSLELAGSATLAIHGAGAVLDVVGNALLESVVPSTGQLSAGALRVGGDVYVQNEAFRATGTELILAGSAAQQIVTVISAGTDPGMSYFRDVTIQNPLGVQFAIGQVWIEGILSSIAAAPIVGDGIIVGGALNAGGDVTANTIRLAALTVAGGYTVGETTFYTPVGGAPVTITAGIPYQDLAIEADVATFAGPTFVAGFLTVGNGESGRNSVATMAGQLDVGGFLAIDGDAITGSVLDPNSHPLFVNGDLVVANGVLRMHDAHTVTVLGNAQFMGGVSSEGELLAGTIVIDAGGGFTSVGDGFRSTGTELVMRGDTLFMSNAGPAAGQGQLASLVLETPSVVVDSVYVSGNVTEASASVVVDRGQIEGALDWYAELRAAGDVNTPTSSWMVGKLALGGAIDIDHSGETPDTVEFFGSGQLIPVTNALSQPLDYVTILVTGPQVTLGNQFVAGGQYTNLSADVIVRGPGVVLDLTSNDDGTIGSLRIEDGDANTRARLGGLGPWTVTNSVVIESGALDVNAQSLDVNASGFEPVALHTLGTGVIELNGLGDALNILAGDARFEGGSTDGLLTEGSITIPLDGGFFSVDDAFRSSGTQLIHLGDTISMRNAGPNAGQGQLASLVYGGGSSELEVADSIYVAGNLSDAAATLLHDQGDDALVTVAGNVTINQSQLVIDHVAIGGVLSLAPTPATNWAVDTTSFFGGVQVAPANATDGFTPISYANVVFRDGGVFELGTAGVDNLSLPNVALHVRDAGTRVLINSNDNGSIGRLLVEPGATGARVRLGGPIGVTDSVRVDGGILDLNGYQLQVNTNGVVPGGITFTNDAILEMNQLEDDLRVVHGPALFTGGSTQDFLTFGLITLVGGDFISVDDGFRSTGTVVFMEGGRLSMTNAGPLAGQGQLFDFAVTNLGILDVTGPAYAAGALVVDFGATLTGAGPLRVAGDADVNGAIITIDHLAMGDSLLLSPSTDFMPDTAEFYGTSQYVPTYLDGELIYGTLLITGSDARIGELGESQFSLENADIVVSGAGASATYRAGGTATPRSLTLENGATDFLVQNTLGIEGAVQVGSGQLRLQNTTLNANVTGLAAIGFSTTGDGTIVMQNPSDFVGVTGGAEFLGGPTAGMLSNGTFTVAGDFYAENGAYQASGTHQTVLAQPQVGIFPVIRMATPGIGAGQDRFRHLRFATNTVTNVASDLYVTGVLSGNASTPATALFGSTTEILTIHADGWQLNQGDSITVNEVTLSLDVDIDPVVDSPIVINGLTFGTFANGATRLRIRHPGFPPFGELGLRDVDFKPSAGYAGAYVHAIDSDGGPDFLHVEIEEQTQVGNVPGDFDSDPQRQIEENGATIGHHVT